jgi:peptidoglycan/LPS O-acetylase OafA/YrhL
VAGTGSDFVKPGYRPDIDGLRAIAVLAVVGFHAFPVWVKGGFVGVDIFFVISAYLITTLLLLNLRRGQFSYVRFYIRRINRLFPALLLILIACLVAGWFLLTAFEYKLFGKHIAAASVYVSNLLLWHEAGYFDIDSELKPLLHLWSLAVEEQFYLVWPPILAFAWRRKWNLPVMLGAILLLSFAADLFELDRDAVATFFSPATRFWELAAGGLLAVLEERGIEPLPGVRTRSLLSIAGVVMLGAGLATIDGNTPFPDWAALLPCGGTFLLIAAGPTAWLNRRVLALRPLVAIGLISYPLYLWHWPLLSFAHIFDTATPSLLTRTVLAVLAFPLATATYFFVEKPIRFGAGGGKKAAVLLGLLLAFGALGSVVYAKQGFPSRTMIGQKRPAVVREPGTPMPACEGRETLPPDIAGICVSHLNAGANQRVVLWGDSHTGAWSIPLVELAKAHGFELFVLRHDGCPPVAGVWRPANNASITLCETPDIMRRIEDGIVALEPNVVLLTARWSLYSHGWRRNGRLMKANGFLADGPVTVATEDTSQAALARQIPASIRQLQANGIRVIVIKNPPVLHWDVNNQRKSLAEVQVPFAEHAALSKFTDDIFARLEDVTIVDPAKDLCHDNTCAVERDAKLLYFDDNHLSAVGVNAFEGELGAVIDRELAKATERKP